MRKSIKVIPLGGGSNIGASCYFLQVDNCNILLDCGRGISSGVIYGPGLNKLIETGLIESVSEIDALFVSHSHFDHIGYLDEFHSIAPNVPIYATFQSKAMAYHLLWDTGGNHDKNLNEVLKSRKEIIAERVLESIITVGFSQRIDFEKFSVTFYEAGHIPGAAMIYIETAKSKILYTGDFAKGKTPLANGYKIPKDLEVNTLIMCGVNAINPKNLYSHKDARVIKRYNKILQKEQVALRVCQLTKGLELANMIGNAMNDGGVPENNIYLDDDIWNLSERLSDMGVYAINKYCKRMKENNFDNGIYITEDSCLKGYFELVNVDFSLHSGYLELQELIKELKPDNVVLVHIGRHDQECNEHILEMDITDSVNRNIKFYYPENNEIYEI